MENLKGIPQWDAEIRKLNINDPGHADIFNPMHQNLLNRDEFLREEVEVLKNLIEDGLNNFVVGVEPIGGVKRVWANDLDIKYSGTWWHVKDDQRIRTNNNPKNAISYEFLGTGIVLIAYLDGGNRSWKYKLDGDIEQKLNLPTTGTGVFGYYCTIPIAEGLAYGKHTIELYPSGEDYQDIRFFYGFDVIQTEDITKNANGVSYIGSVRTEILADHQNYSISEAGRSDLLVVNKDGLVQTLEGMDGISERAFRVEEDGCISREYIEYIPNWLKKVTIWGDITNDILTGWTDNYQYARGSNYSNEKSIASKTGGSQLFMGFIGVGVDIIYKSYNYDIRSINVSVDGGAPIRYDFNTGQSGDQVRINIANGLPFGYHEVAIEVTTDTTGIVYIDAFDIYLPKEPDLPLNVQPLAKVYHIPEPANMINLPRRPTTSEEKGWIRFDDNEGCRYVGTWNDLKFKSNSGGGYKQTRVTGDYCEFTFIGTGIRYLGRVAPDKGKVNIYVDGVEVASQVSLYNSTDYMGHIVLYENTLLSYGVHTIKIENSGITEGTDTLISVDAFEIHRPLWLIDMRCLSPIQKTHSYKVEHQNKIGKALPYSVGGMLDRLEMMDNIIRIENENGIATLFPDGRAECEMVVSIPGSGNGVTNSKNCILPATLSKVTSVVVLPLTNDTNTNATCTVTDNTITLYWQTTINATARILSVFVKGRWK